MAKQAKRRKSHFFGFTVFYACLFAAIGVVGLHYLWDFMVDYESTQVSHHMESYMESLDDEHILEMCSGFKASLLTSPLQSETAADAAILEHVHAGGAFTYSRKNSDVSGTDIVYALRLGGKAVGEVEVRQKEDSTFFGFHHWETVRDELAFPELIGGTSFTVPADCTVYCNGVQLGDEYVTERNIPYTLCTEFYNSKYPMPYKQTYAVDNLVGKIDIEIIKPDGTVFDFDTFEDNDYLNNCTDEENAAMEAFLTDFVKFYVAYSSGVNNNHLLDYYNLAAYLVDDSELTHRMYQALEGLNYTNSKSAVVRTIRVDNCMKLTTGEYLCDIVYTVDNMNYYQSEYTRTVNEWKLIVINTAKGLRVLEMLNVRTGLADGTE